jgi:NAD(P)-dependent dehydrogenase (short-subunit alcohol dehydrogenase family)
VTGALDGQAVLLTGGGSGLGRAIVERFIAEGAQVAFLERNPAKVDAVSTEMPGVLGIAGDIRNPADSEQAVAAVVERFGGLDCLIGTAAITDYLPTFSGYDRERLTPAFDEVLHTNVLGHILVATAARDALVRSRGSIILTLSTSGIYPGGQGAMYSVSKAALTMVVKQLAYELAPAVRVNGVVPGVVADSDIRGPEALGQQADTPTSLFPGLQDAARQMNPLRICPPGSAYAGFYVTLASRRDGLVGTGAILNWDSGIGLIGHGFALDASMADEQPEHQEAAV